MRPSRRLHASKKSRKGSGLSSNHDVDVGSVVSSRMTLRMNHRSVVSFCLGYASAGHRGMVKDRAAAAGALCARFLIQLIERPALQVISINSVLKDYHEFRDVFCFCSYIVSCMA